MALFEFIRMGYSDNPTNDELRKIYLITLFTVVGVLALSGFGFLSLYEGRTAYGLTLLGISTLVIINYAVLRVRRNLIAAALFLTTMMAFLNFGFLLRGGVENTGPLWFYILPLLAYFLLGSGIGSIFIGVFYVLSMTWLLVPDMPWMSTEYSAHFRQRFAASFTAVCILSVVYEHTRAQVYDAMMALGKRLEVTAMTDELTGLANRRHARHRLENEFRRVEREQQRLSVILSDVDHFKSINDDFSHELGDRVLVRIAEALKLSLREYDLASRWGGEEFLIILPGSRLSDAIRVAERLREAIQDVPWETFAPDLKVTLSLGVAEMDGDVNVEGLVHRADEHLYEAKQQGRNRVSF